MSVLSDKSVIKQLNDVRIVESDFTPEGETEPITYKGLIIDFTDPDGEIQSVKFVPHASEGKQAYNVLKFAVMNKKQTATV